MLNDYFIIRAQCIRYWKNKKLVIKHTFEFLVVGTKPSNEEILRHAVFIIYTQ